MSKKGATKSSGRNRKARGEAGQSNAAPTPLIRTPTPPALKARLEKAIKTGKFYPFGPWIGYSKG
ncbi:MAG TPA: hypothetical protein ENI23_12740 [bacterium]|nr:hypothetical protein [bacterium]